MRVILLVLTLLTTKPDPWIIPNVERWRPLVRTIMAEQERPEEITEEWVLAVISQETTSPSLISWDGLGSRAPTEVKNGSTIQGQICVHRRRHCLHSEVP